jgi:hypothetical protein
MSSKKPKGKGKTVGDRAAARAMRSVGTSSFESRMAKIIDRALSAERRRCIKIVRREANEHADWKSTAAPVLRHVANLIEGVSHP